MKILAPRLTYNFTMTPVTELRIEGSTSLNVFILCGARLSFPVTFSPSKPQIFTFLDTF